LGLSMGKVHCSLGKVPFFLGNLGFIVHWGRSPSSWGTWASLGNFLEEVSLIFFTPYAKLFFGVLHLFPRDFFFLLGNFIILHWKLTLFSRAICLRLTLNIFFFSMRKLLPKGNSFKKTI
jgi:hypothetical protein